MTPAKPIPAFIRQALKKVHPEVTDRSLTLSVVASDVFTRILTLYVLYVCVLLPQVLWLWSGGARVLGGLQDTGPGQWKWERLLHAQSAGWGEGSCHWYRHDRGPGTVHQHHRVAATLPTIYLLLKTHNPASHGLFFRQTPPRLFTVFTFHSSLCSVLA